MRSIITFGLFTVLFSLVAYAEDLVPGVLSFEPPAFLKALPPPDSEHGEFSPDAMMGAAQIKQYQATNSSNPSSQRIDMRIRLVGATLGNGKRWTYRPLDDKALRAELQHMFQSNGVTNAPIVDEKLGGQPAFGVSFTGRPRPDEPLVYSEFFWIRYESNRVIEIHLRADSPANLRSLKDSLSKLKVRRKDAYPAHALDGGIPCLSDIGRHRPAASDEHRWLSSRIV